MITIEGGILASALKNAASIVVPSTIQILASVRLEYIDGALEIVTNNLDAEYRQRLPLDDPGELCCAVEARRLASIASAAPPGAMISMEQNDGRMVVKAGRSRWMLPALPVDDFPTMPADRLCEPLEIGTEVLATAIKRTVWSAWAGEGRPYLAGVLLNPEFDKLRFAASNGATAIALDIAAAWPDGAPEVIVPTKFMRTLEMVCAGKPGSVALSWDDRKIRADLGDIVLTGKLIEDRFPDYRRIIPPESNSFIVEPGALSDAIRRVQLASDEKARKLRIVRNSGCLAIRIEAEAGRDGFEEVAADCEESFETGVNAAYLAQMLEAIGGDSVEIHQQDAGAPFLVRRVVPDGAIGVISPMRI